MLAFCYPPYFFRVFFRVNPFVTIYISTLFGRNFTLFWERRRKRAKEVEEGRKDEEGGKGREGEKSILK